MVIIFKKKSRARHALRGNEATEHVSPSKPLTTTIHKYTHTWRLLVTPLSHHMLTSSFPIFPKRVAMNRLVRFEWLGSRVVGLLCFFTLLPLLLWLIVRVLWILKRVIQSYKFPFLLDCQTSPRVFLNALRVKDVMYQNFHAGPTSCEIFLWA